MKGCVALLVLLFCLSGAAGAPGENGPVSEGQSDAEPGSFIPPGLWVALVELRNMVEAQQEKMKTMEEHMTVMADKLSASESHVAEIQARLNTGEVQVEDLKEESEAHLAQLTSIATRLTAAESQVHQLWRVFSAPAKGLYLFTYAAFHRWSSDSFCVYMSKNERSAHSTLLYNCGYNSAEFEQLSNGLMVELEEGDTVEMLLGSAFRLSDNHNNFNVFSGVLLYAM